MPKHQHISRYDFVDGLQSNETGSINGLVEEIDKENRPVFKNNRSKESRDALKKVKEGKGSTKERLDYVRDRIRETINRSVTTRDTLQIPLTDLKTIYLLYRCNDDNGIELFGRLKPPHLTRPSLEFRTEGDALGNDSYIPIFDHLQAQFRKEITKERLDLIHQHVPTRDIMLLEIRKKNTRIINTLREWLQGDSDSITAAYQELAKDIDGFTPHEEPSTNPLHEALYTHIQALPFQHHVYGFERAVQKAYSNLPVICIELDLMRFCQRLGEGVHPLLSKVTSVNQFTTFASEHAMDFMQLVEKATGAKTDGRQFKTTIEPARRILNILSKLHYFRDNHAGALSPLDCIAALCTSRFQVGRNRPEKIEDDPYWIGQSSQGSNLVQQLDTDRPIEDLYVDDSIPHSAKQILYHRFGFISSALIHDTKHHKAYMDFQIARLKKHAEILRSNDVDVIIQSLDNLEFYIQTILMKFNPSLQLPPLPHMAINEWLKDGY